MAYNKENVVHVTADVTKHPQTFEYHSTDTVTTAGYFPSNDIFKPGDKIVKVVVTKSSGLVTEREETPYYLVDDENGVLTATAYS